MKLPARRPSAPPEDSVAMRVVVAVAVELGIVAVALQGAVDAFTTVMALALAPLGYVFSYRRRRRSGVAVKVVLAVALLAATGQFLSAMRLVASVDEARVPLAALFLWVQVLHAFDVPRRRDLAFSMVSSTTLVAAGGALSLITSYIWILLVWAGLAAAWLWLSARPRADEVTTPVAVRRTLEARRPRAAGPRSATAAGVAAVLAGTAVFLAMLRLPATLVRTPPFSLGQHAPMPSSQDGVSNPGLPSAGTDGVVDFAPGGYPGFSDAMDLRARGALSDDVVFRVRADQAALWRAEAFDTFDGSVWTASRTAARAVSVGWDTQSATVPYRDLESKLPSAFSNEVVQTFYLDSVQPNVLLAAAKAEKVYFPSGGLRVDRYGSIRAPILLDQGLVYSVVSRVPAVPDALLAQVRPPNPEALSFAPYLQLPPSTTQRERALAAQLAQGSASEQETVLRVQSWLQTNTVYDLTVAREPDGVDAIDHFLFVTRRGFCEHIASAMAILLRADGIPARIVTGYGPGERNPLTGYWEVRQSDAHAWVEVYYPQVGWLPYDPTFGVPPAEPSFGSRFMFTDAFAAMARTVGAAIPGPVKAAVGEAGRSIASATGTVTGTVSRAWPIAVVVAAVALLALAARRRRRRRSPPPSDAAAAAFEELVAALAPTGHAREPSDTPSEFLEAIETDPALAEDVVEQAALVVRTFEAARFAPPSDRPGHVEIVRARAAAAHVREMVRKG